MSTKQLIATPKQIQNKAALYSAPYLAVLCSHCSILVLTKSDGMSAFLSPLSRWREKGPFVSDNETKTCPVKSSELTTVFSEATDLSIFYI